LLLGEYAAALEASRRVVAVLEEIGDVWNLSVALMVSSRTAAALGDFGKALEGAARGAALAQQLHVIRFRVYNLLTLGIVHREMEDVHAAWQIDREAADLAAQVGGAWLPLALTWRACDEAARGRLDDALTLQAQARRVVEEGQMQVETEEVTATDCRLALQRGDAAGALESVSHLLAHIDEHGTRHWRPPALLLRAECLAGLGRREAATRAFQDAVEDAERIGAAPVLWRALAGLAEQQRAADDLQASVESARQGHAVVERLAASVPDEGLRATFLQSQRVQRLVTLAG
jgi:tetratricopeptide (TPR) repeat protein